MSSLLSRIKKANTLTGADVLSNSKFFVDSFNDTGIPLLNVAMSSRIDGGYSHGSTLIGGFSATFKTLFMLALAKSHLENFPDSIFVYYDVEFGSNQGTFESAGLDTSRIYHKPFTTIEELTVDFVTLLNELEETDEVVFGVDSLGAAKSRKSVEDTIKGSDKRDMTAQQAMGNFWGQVNPILNVKKFPMFAVGQLYNTMEMYGKPKFRGGESMYYYPNNRWIITKANDKDKKTNEKLGSIFTINIEKSRFVKEGSKFPIKVTWDDGIDLNSGIFDMALALGIIVKETAQTYNIPLLKIDKARRKTLEVDEIMKEVIALDEFQKLVHQKYHLGVLNVDGEESEEVES